MKRLILGRAVLGFIGLAVWIYGYREDDANIRLAAIGGLFVALLLGLVYRWMERRAQREDESPEP